MERQHHVRILFDEDAIARRNEELAKAIVAATAPDLIVIAVLKGSFMFAADLIRALHRENVSPQVEFIHLSSYGTGTVSRGTVAILRDIESEVAGRDVLLVDDILESGRTLSFAKDLLMARGARRVFVAVLLEKANKRAVSIHADFVGFPCPDLFVVGYGMDVAHNFRQLPFVGVVTQGDSEPDLFDGRETLMAKILLVDDEETVRGFLKRGLELDGHTVTTAIDGADAMDRLGEAEFELLLTDIRMPIMDGIALAVSAKRDRPDLTIVLMTGYAEQRERAKNLEAIVADVLTKPFSLAELRAAVKRVLDERTLPAS